MSVRAHRVIEFRLAQPGFDLWHNDKFAQFLKTEVRLSSNLDSYGTGLLEVPV
ncbi:MAG: hypothetical protein HY663_01765 [Chloroflexi bacterium]|nr:hypothetical protein [Chloroflexota bacterium]